MEHVTEGQDNAHRETIIPPIRLREPELLLHAHRGQRPRGHAGEDHPEPIALRLDNTAVMGGGEAGHESAVLRQQGIEIRLGQSAEPYRRALDVGLHDDCGAPGRHAHLPGGVTHDEESPAVAEEAPVRPFFSFAAALLTDNCRATRRLCPSCEVNYSFWQPLS